MQVASQRVPLRLKRRFQFGLRALLLAPVFLAVVWWWGTWPERTVRQFKARIASGKLQDANAMIENPDHAEPGMELILGGTYFRAHYEHELFELDEPSLLDLVTGQRTCKWRYLEGMAIVHVNRSRLGARLVTGEPLVLRIEE